jgi:hydroxymethylpyrimidine pyrophosphatase-like HAD family hydrolase
MRYRALASDYDGTLATDGVVDEATLDALRRLRTTGWKLILVTGRELDELIGVFPQIELFDRVVAENGAVLYRPAKQEIRLLGEPPPEAFVTALRDRVEAPVAVGRVIVATWRPQETIVFDVIRDLGLDRQVIFNKEAVMILPTGVDKAAGLEAAFDELELAPDTTVAVGDAENDLAFLELCGCAVAVANALQSVKEQADIVTVGARGAGVAELIDRLIAGDLRDPQPPLRRAD